MTRQQKKAVRKALRQYGRKQKAANAAGCAAAGPDPWGRVIRQVLDYYAEADGTCAALLRLRYLEEWPEAETIERLHIGRTTYYHKELETLSKIQNRLFENMAGEEFRDLSPFSAHLYEQRNKKMEETDA